MNAPAKAVFSFTNFKIPDFSLREFDPTQGFQARFDPHGIYDPETGRFSLTLLFEGFQRSAEDTPVLTARMISTFSFGEQTPASLEEIPAYFYANVIAITFPYLRSFVTSMTAQAALKPVIMPLFNLVELEPVFRAQTVIFQKETPAENSASNP